MAQKARNRKENSASRIVAYCVAGAVLIGLARFWGYPWLNGYAAWQRAQAALVEDNFAEARPPLEECAAWWPNDVEVQLLAARVCRRARDGTAAAQYLNQAIRLNEAQRIEALDPAINLELALQKAQFGDVRAVEADLFGLLKVGHYEEILIMEAMARGFLQANLLSNVAKCAGFWSEKYPGDWRPQYYWGFAFEMAGDNDKAINRYQAVVELKPDHLEARQRLGSLLRRSGLPREALVHLLYCFDRQPDVPEVVVELGHCLVMLARADEARQLLDRWIAAHGDKDASILQARGEVEIESKGPAEALPWLRRAEKIAPQDYHIVTLLARALREAGHNEQAESYEKRRDKINLDLKRLDQILRDVLSDTENAPLRFEAGTILMRIGKPTQALRWFFSVLEVDNNHAPTHLALADYYESIGDKEKAQNHRDTAAGKKRAILH